jgi:hypothetical protein
MSLVTIAVPNAILAVASLATLAYVCRIPFRLDRFHRLESEIAN